ncbi:hypothetical protein LINPERHAP1_LOCUS3635, partial [Linum perenne]
MGRENRISFHHHTITPTKGKAPTTTPMSTAADVAVSSSILELCLCVYEMLIGLYRAIA